MNTERNLKKLHQHLINSKVFDFINRNFGSVLFVVDEFTGKYFSSFSNTLPFEHQVIGVDSACDLNQKNHDAVVIWAIDPTQQKLAVTHTTNNSDGHFLFISDLLLPVCAHVSDADIVSRKIKTKLPKEVYGVFCCARSGSTYLCELLQNTNKLGSPTEHLRPHIAYFIKTFQDDGFNPTLWLKYLISNNVENDVFGTKFIAHFLKDAINALNTKNLDELKNFLSSEINAKYIYLERQDKVAQSVSAFVANQTSIWHAHSKKAIQEANKLTAAVEYDFDKIKTCYNNAHSNESYLRELISFLPATGLHVIYEELCEKTDSSLDEIHKCITGISNQKLFRAKHKIKKLKGDKKSMFSKRFEEELRLTSAKSATS